MPHAPLRWLGLSLALIGLMLVLSALMVGEADASPNLHGTTTPGAPDDHPDDEAFTAAIENPTYYEHIEPILQANCMACHTGGQIGQAVFDMADTANILEHADDIRFVVQARSMPPWMPGPESPPMRGTRGLSDGQIGTIVAWAQAGGPEGDPAARSDERLIPEWPTIREDLVVAMPEVYTPDEQLYDDYRCFLIDADLPADRFITAFQVEPGQQSIVHHVVVYQVPEIARPRAELRDRLDEGPGWQCFGGPNVGLDAGLEDAVGAWTPGALPIVFPEGTGRRLRHDSLLVLQVHYNLEAGTQPDQTRVAFQLADEGADIQPIQLFVMFAPVELPCAADNPNPDCDRDTAIANARAEAKFEDVELAQWFLRRCQRTPEDYIHQDAEHIVSTCDYPAPTDAQVIGALAHMHTRGTTFRMEVNPDSDNARVLLDIPYWDFNWQGEYLYQEPQSVHRGDVVRLTCTWDNSAGNRYIIWGEGTYDEMCIGWLAAIAPE